MKRPKRLFNNYLLVSEQLRGRASSNCFGEYLHFFNLSELLTLWKPAAMLALLQIRNFLFADEDGGLVPAPSDGGFRR